MTVNQLKAFLERCMGSAVVLVDTDFDRVGSHRRDGETWREVPLEAIKVDCRPSDFSDEALPASCAGVGDK